MNVDTGAREKNPEKQAAFRRIEYTVGHPGRTYPAGPLKHFDDAHQVLVDFTQVASLQADIDLVKAGGQLPATLVRFAPSASQWNRIENLYLTFGWYASEEALRNCLAFCRDHALVTIESKTFDGIINLIFDRLQAEVDEGAEYVGSPGWLSRALRRRGLDKSRSEDERSLVKELLYLDPRFAASLVHLVFDIALREAKARRTGVGQVTYSVLVEYDGRGRRVRLI